MRGDGGVAHDHGRRATVAVRWLRDPSGTLEHGGREGDDSHAGSTWLTRPRRVLLVDDHEMSRRGLEAMLSTADWVEVVGEAGSCESGLAEIAARRPDIVLLDIRMPGVDGLACLAEIKKLDHPVAVVIVTMYDDRHYVLEAIRRAPPATCSRRRRPPRCWR